MQSESTLRMRITTLLPRLAFFFCIIQPILDVIGYVQDALEIGNTITMTIRAFLLLSVSVLGFYLTGKKRVYLIFAAVVALYLTGHILACAGNTGGYLNWVEDLIDQMRTLLLPITTLCFITFFRENEKTVAAVKNGLFVNLCLIVLVMLVSAATGTDPHTYIEKEIGVRGWFIWSSAQSAILSMLAPLAIVWSLERFPGKSLPLAAVSLIAFGVLFAFGTRLAFVTIPIVGLVLSVTVLLADRRQLSQAIVIFLAAALFTALLPLSPMVKNRSAMRVNAETRRQRISATATLAGAEPGAKTTDNPDVLSATYRYNLSGLIQRFGLERVARLYGNTLDSETICNDRTMKASFCRLEMEDATKASPLSQFFGIELRRTREKAVPKYSLETDSFRQPTDPYDYYDPENDFKGVCFLCGLNGLILLVGWIGGIGLRSGVCLLKDRKKYLQPQYMAWLLSFALAVCYAWFTVSVLRRNNASVYFALILAVLWYQSSRKTTQRSST